ncbi:hypothetical protein ColKHC_10487 [Colletotrichum higginsianum]|nr:hypothetical protein ColKHC_10487 [Colletotrichum higginsianum]
MVYAQSEDQTNVRSNAVTAGRHWAVPAVNVSRLPRAISLSAAVHLLGLCRLSMSADAKTGRVADDAPVRYPYRTVPHDLYGTPDVLARSPITTGMLVCLTLRPDITSPKPPSSPLFGR